MIVNKLTAASQGTDSSWRLHLTTLMRDAFSSQCTMPLFLTQHAVSHTYIFGYHPTPEQVPSQYETY